MVYHLMPNGFDPSPPDPSRCESSWREFGGQAVPATHVVQPQVRQRHEAEQDQEELQDLVIDRRSSGRPEMYK